MTLEQLLEEVTNKYNRYAAEIVRQMILWAQEYGEDSVGQSLDNLMYDDDLNNMVADYIEKELKS